MKLTRYLYDKDKVVESLHHSVQIKNFQQSLFWGYELYFSGFSDEVLEILENIYQTRFSQNHPKLGVYLRKKQEQIKDKPEWVATILKNLTMKNPDIPETPSVKFVNVKPHHIEPFMTKEPEGPGWQFLRKVCVYGVKGQSTNVENFRKKWLIFAIESPIWKKRVEEYGGTIESGVVVFLDEDKEEAFYNRFDYEPDEQPDEIQKKCVGW
jgi:hypothetical protein